MSLIEKMEADYIVAYKAKDAIRLTVLRLLRTAAKNLQVEKMRPIDEGEALDLVSKQVKQRRDSIEQFRAAKREDLAAKEEAELQVLLSYLPQPLSKEELAAAIEEAIAKSSASAPKDMGKVMQILTASCKGRVEGKVLSDAVKARLAGN